jgi:hypothetical protein
MAGSLHSPAGIISREFPTSPLAAAHQRDENGGVERL